MPHTSILPVIFCTLLLLIPSATRAQSSDGAEDQTYHEYLDRFYFGSPRGTGIPVDVVVALRDTRTYYLPSTESDKIGVISEGTVLNVMENRRDLHFNLLEKRGDIPKTTRRERLRWAPINQEGRIVWVDSGGLRPASTSERQGEMLRTLEVGLRHAFPEKTLGGKILGWLVSIPISVGLGLFAGRLLGRFSYQFMGSKFGLDDTISMVTPIVLWLLKTKWISGTSLTETFVLVYGMGVVFIVSSLPSEIIMKGIQLQRQASRRTAAPTMRIG